MNALKMMCFSVVLACCSTSGIAGGREAGSQAPDGCSFQAIQSDAVLSKQLIIKTDPAGLAVQPVAAGTDVAQLLQDYVNTHQCTLSALSVGDLSKGLLKGMPSALPDNQGKASSNEQAGKYILIQEDMAVCVKKLGLHLPIKQFLPTLPTRS